MTLPRFDRLRWSNAAASVAVLRKDLSYKPQMYKSPVTESQGFGTLNLADACQDKTSTIKS